MKKIERREVEIIPCDLLERESNNGGREKNRERKRLVKIREKGERKGLIKKNRGNFVFTTHLLTKTIKMIIVDKNNKSP